MKWEYPVPESWINNLGLGFLDKMKSGTLHPGVDLNNPSGGNSDLGEPITSCADGVCEYAEDSGAGFGKHTFIRHEVEGETIYSHYAHLDAIQIAAGDEVKCGQQIGTCGYSGRYSGNWWTAHLHFEIRRPIGKGYTFWPSGWGADQITHYYFDPIKFIKEHNQGEKDMTKDETRKLIKELIEEKEDKADIRPQVAELEQDLKDLHKTFEDYQKIAAEHRVTTDDILKQQKSDANILLSRVNELSGLLRALQDDITGVIDINGKYKETLNKEIEELKKKEWGEVSDDDKSSNTGNNQRPSVLGSIINTITSWFRRSA